MTLDFNLIAVIAINIIGALLIATVILRNSFSDKITSVYVVMSLLMFTWIDFAYLARVIGLGNLYWADLFLRIAWVATPPFFAYVYLITINIIKGREQNRTLNTVAVTIALALGLTTAFTDYIIAGVSFSGSDLDIVYGPGFFPFLGIISIYIIATLIPIFSHNVEPERRRRVRIFSAGVILFVVLNLIFNIALPVFAGITHLYYFGDYSLFFIVSFTAYAIIRHGLMDIRSVIFRAVIFFGITSSFFIVSGGLVYLVLESLSEFKLDNLQLAIIATVNTVIAILGYGYFKEVLSQVTDRFLFQRKANYRQALVDLGENLTDSIEMPQVSGQVLKTMESVVRSRKAVIMLFNTEKSFLRVRGQFGAPNFSASIPADHTLIKHFQEDHQVIIEDEAARQGQDNLVDTLEWLSASAIVPLLVHGELTGVILIGDKLSGEPYWQDDVEFLQATGPIISTALENARLYQESLEFSEKLKAEVKRATADLASANSQLKELDKAKSEFLSIASHQLYTPITALRGYLSMLEEGDFGQVPDQQREVLQILDKSTGRLIELIKNLLDISRIESGRFKLNLEKVDLAEMAHELITDLMPNATNKRLALTYHPPQSKQFVIADRDRIRQVMLNFLDNAIKYTEHGRIDVYVEYTETEARYSVKDTGRGLAPDAFDKLFKKFSRVNDTGDTHTEGTGLGLYVARQIVNEHHGDVFADSPGLEKGSTFTMSMPVAGTSNSLSEEDEATVVIKAT